MNIRILLPVFFLITLGCNRPNEKKISDLEEEVNDSKSTSAVPDSVINVILQQIPSPLEMSALIKETGARYNKSFLSKPESYSKFNNSYSRALNLGIYGADLGYSNLYEENQQCILYVGAIKELSDELRIDQFFNFKLIERLADERNLDSLLLISTQSYNEVNKYFQEEQRSGLSILLLVGGWVEALYISCEVAAETPSNKPLIEKIGEQKIVIQSLIQLVGYFSESDENFAKLNLQLTELSKIYDSVIINRTYGEPTTTVVNGVVVTKDNSKSSIKMDNDSFIQIKNKIQNIRLEIVS
jgi:hypothetical protein